VRTIAVLNFKGGSGKTTTALSLAVGIAHKLPKRQRVLLVDCDPQSNATLIMLDGTAPTGPTLADVLINDTGTAEAIRGTRVDRLDILPADVGLANVGGLLADELARERRLHRALKRVEGRYAVCVIDCPPELTLLTVNILTAATEVLIPIDPGVFAVAGLGRLQETIDRVRHHLEHTELGVLGLLVTRATRNKMATDLEHQLREVYGPLVFKSVIPTSAAVEEAHASNRTILEWSPGSPAGKAYAELVVEVLKHEQGKRTPRKRRQGPHAA
jgi:chromosome partitioning protein